MQVTASLIIVPLFVCQGAVADETPGAKQYQALLEQYQEEGGARMFAKRFLELAEQHPTDPAAVDALLWVVKNVV